MTMFTFFLQIIFFGALVVQLFFWLFVFSKLAFFKNDDFKNGQPIVARGKPVSVIICARNEAANLQRNLPTILNQDYPQF